MGFEFEDIAQPLSAQSSQTFVTQRCTLRYSPARRYSSLSLVIPFPGIRYSQPALDELLTGHPDSSVLDFYSPPQSLNKIPHPNGCDFLSVNYNSSNRRI